MKRVISSSIIALGIIGILGVGFYYLKNYTKSSEPAINAIPPEASFFIDFFSDAGNVKKLLSSNYFSDGRSEPLMRKLIQGISKVDSITQANKAFSSLLKASHLIVSAHVTKAADFDLLYLLSLPSGYSASDCEELVKLFGNDPGASFQNRNYDGVSIWEWPLENGSSFTFTISKGVFAGSFTSFLVEDAIRQQKLKKPFGGDKAFLRLYEAQSIKNEDKLYFQYRNLSKWLNVFSDPEKGNAFSLLSDFANWTCLSLHAEKDHISFSGISEAIDSSSFLQIFKNQLPVTIELPDLLPSRTAAFLNYSFSDSRSYFNSLQQYLKKSKSGARNEQYINTLDAAYRISVRGIFQNWISKEYAFVISEPGGTNFDNNLLAIFSTKDSQRAIDDLKMLSERVASKQGLKRTEEKYNGHVIGLVNLDNILPALYGDVFLKLNKSFYTSVRGYIIFANKASTLRSFIDDYESNHFLFRKNENQIIRKQSSKSNFSIYGRIPACRYIIKSVLSGACNKQFDSYKTVNQWDGFYFSVKHTGSEFETTAEIQYAQKPASGVNLVWSAELDSILISPPCFVTLGNDQNGVLVQDALLQLYLIDNAGNIRWKKKLIEPIKGAIHAIDLFKNGQVQYVFNTISTLEMIDTSGADFSGYPIRLPAHATNAMALFDYEATSDYRIYIACENGKVYAYEPGGKPLPGWDFSQLTGTISDPIRHFRHDMNDFLLFNDNLGNVFIVDKIGQNMIKVRQKLFKRNSVPFYLDEDKEGNYCFATLDTAGNICSIMPDGFIRVHPLMEIPVDAGFALSDLNQDDENDYLLNNRTQLSLYQLDSFRVFCRIPGGKVEPEIRLFPLAGNDLKIGVWSGELGKIYLFNKDGSLYKGFPVKGEMPFTIDEINNDVKSNVLTGYKNEVLLYLLE